MSSFTCKCDEFNHRCCMYLFLSHHICSKNDILSANSITFNLSSIAKVMLRSKSSESSTKWITNRNRQKLTIESKRCFSTALSIFCIILQDGDSKSLADLVCAYFHVKDSGNCDPSKGWFLLTSWLWLDMKFSFADFDMLPSLQSQIDEEKFRKLSATLSLYNNRPSWGAEGRQCAHCGRHRPIRHHGRLWDRRRGGVGRVPRASEKGVHKCTVSTVQLSIWSRNTVTWHQIKSPPLFQLLILYS